MRLVLFAVAVCLCAQDTVIRTTVPLVLVPTTVTDRHGKTVDAGLHVTRQQLHKVIQGQSAITPDMPLRLEAAFGGSADWWVRMQAAYELAQARERNATPSIQRFKPKKVA